MSRIDVAESHDVLGRSHLTLEPMTTNVGAVVHGMDVHARHPSAVAKTLQHWLHQCGVLFFHSDREVSDDDLRVFASHFGEIYKYPYGINQDPNRDIFYMSANDASSSIRHRTSVWHTDGAPNPTPPQTGLLAPVLLPSVGGDTMWAHMGVAFEALSPTLQRLLDGMEAIHSTDAIKRHFPSQDDHGIFGDGERSTHPVVLSDPFTKQRLLYVNSNSPERMVGMSDEESTRLLEMLLAHINTPEFHVRLRWRPNMIAVWDQRVTQHRAVADYTEPRTLRRMTLRGDPPVR